MASEVAWNQLRPSSTPLTVLDPMAGSGTTLVTARMRGHKAIGFDRDPLAVLISKAWVANIDAKKLESKAQTVLKRARALSRKLELDVRTAFPARADNETKKFIRYWFDRTNRVQLTALSQIISGLRDPSLRGLLWCAFSRLIITKKVGASLAMDVSHSRPHRKYKKAPIEALDHFERSVRQITKSSPFSSVFSKAPTAKVENADARDLPLKANSVDVVITSPPYLNAIDYLRGHKLSLVWMGHSISKIRDLRSTNIGCETLSKLSDEVFVNATVKSVCTGPVLSSRDSGILKQYVHDLKRMLLEIQRVLRPEGKAILVVGNCNIRNTFVKNSLAIEITAKNIGLIVRAKRTRILPTNRRYLPPPCATGAGKALQKRMREEVILTLIKTSQNN